MSADTQLEQYREYRELSRKLHEELIEALPRERVLQGAARLGLLRGDDTLMLGDKEDLNVVMDFVLYHQPDEQGKTPIALRRETSPGEGAAAALLAAMARSTYAVLRVDQALPSGRLRARILQQDRPVLLIDEGLSRSVEPGRVIAGNLIELPGFAMLSGATLGVSAAATAQIQRDFVAKVGGEAGEMEPDEWAALVVRACLEARHAEIDKARPSRADRRALGGVSTTKRAFSRPPSKNAPCPCGSGRRYKSCCGREAAG